ncbi:sigma-70 family RNA polymerase sigma factor [Paracoccaceae bacterium GXU_MW_L88]
MSLSPRNHRKQPTARQGTGSVQSDEELIAAYAGGDERAARQIADRLLPPVLSLARYMLSDPAEAEDVAQETLLRLWKLAPNWEAGRAKPETWAYRVAANLCTDRLRRRKRISGEEVPEQEDDTPGAEAQLGEADRAAALRAALATLPERQRLALVLRHFQDHSQAQIAEVMEISEEAVESLLARGKRSLAATLESRRAALSLETGS